MTAWINAFLGRLEARDVHVHEQTAPGLTPARLLTVRADDWGALAHEAKKLGVPLGRGLGRGRGRGYLGECHL